jgi:hypothetical protein
MNVVVANGYVIEDAILSGATGSQPLAGLIAVSTVLLPCEA